MIQIHYAGLFSETLPSGNVRWRVRVEKDPRRKITLRCEPDHPKFYEHYRAARMGIQLEAEAKEAPAVRGSVKWLAALYIDAMPKIGLQKETIHQRAQFINWLASEVGEYNAEMPQSELVKLRDKKADTPGAADNFVKSVRAMYAWGIERGHVKANPASGIGKINAGTGARPWTVDDLRKYRERHQRGTMAHLALSLFMFTACRIGDAFILGRGNEIQVNGETWLSWQPEKKGSTKVVIPMMPPLYEATRAMTVQGKTYLLNGNGQPFASKNAFGNKFRDWVAEAGLSGLSSHGIRKAAGELLALHGATQYHVMAVHGHSNAKTSEVYTRNVERMQLAGQAMQLLRGMDW